MYTLLPYRLIRWYYLLISNLSHFTICNCWVLLSQFVLMLCLVIKLALVFFGVAMFAAENEVTFASKAEKAHFTLALPAQWFIHLCVSLWPNSYLLVLLHFFYLWLWYLQFLLLNYFRLLLRTSNWYICQQRRQLLLRKCRHRGFRGALLRSFGGLRGLG